MVRNPVCAGIVIGGAVAALGLAVTAQVRSGQPLAADVPFWVLTASAGVLALLAGWGIATSRPIVRRLLGAIVLIAGIVALSTRVWRFVDPYVLPDSYTSTRPLVLASATILALLGLIVLLARIGPVPARRGRAVFAGLVASLVVLLVAAVGAGETVHVAQQRNVEATGPSAPPHTAAAPTLDGGLAWQATGGAGDRFAVTAGGVAQYLRDGVRVLDPATGRQRWAYRRRDVSLPESVGARTVVAADGAHLLAATEVLDATSGAALGSIPGATDDELGEPTDWIVGDTVLDVDGKGNLTADTVSGQQRWTRPYNGCIYIDAQPGPDGDVVVDQFCGGDTSNYWVTLLNGGTGAVRWQRKVGSLYQLLPGGGGRIVLGRRQNGTLIVERLNPANGKPLWTTGLPTTTESGQFMYEGYRALYLAGGELVVSDPTGTTAGALAGLNPDTGAVDWTDRNLLPVTLPDGTTPAVVASVATLPDGRTVLLTGTTDGTGLAIRQLNPSTGTTTVRHAVALPEGAAAIPATATLTVSHGALLLTGVRDGDEAADTQLACRLR